MTKQLLGAIVVALSFVSLGKTAEPKDAALAKSASAMFAQLQMKTLPNGLRVYMLPIPGCPTVTTMVAYKVGACDEDKDQTGLSHYLEHLLFKGTEKLMPGDVDRLTQRNGGRNNAYTSEDMTVYHFDFAADRWQAALEIEADRMRNVRIDAKHEFEQEKGAVISELKGGEDQPFDLEYKAILPMLFGKNSPYSHPVIGEEKHVRGATAEIIKRYYDKWYHPNNAALVIVGGFDPAATSELVTKLFASIPKIDVPDRKPENKLPARTAQLRKEFPSKFDVPRAMIGFNTVKSGDKDDFALAILNSILTGGRTSRLYKKLVETDRLCSNVSSMNSTGRYSGWYGVMLEMLKGKDRAQAEKVMFAELETMAKTPVTEAELNRAKRGILAGYIYSKEDPHSLADVIAQTVTTHDEKYLATYLDKLMAVSAEDIQRVAGNYLTKPQSVVVWSMPAVEKATTTAEDKPEEPKKPNRLYRKPEASGASAVKLTDAKRVVLPNGLTLIMLENRRLPIVVANVSIKDVRLKEPAEKAGLGALVGSLLDEGTTKHTSDEIATKIEDVGGSMGFTSSGGSLKVLTPDTDLGLGLLFDSLIRPSFPKDGFERMKEQQLAEIEDDESQPRSRSQAAFSKIIYGDHPFGRSVSGKKETLEKLTIADCQAFHKSIYGPNVATVVVVGDFDAKEMQAKIEKLTADWAKATEVGVDVPAPAKIDKPVLKIIPDETAAQTHVYIGHLGIKRSDPDYYALLVMDNVLGVGPGFTDRLSSTLRDRQGLAYTVNASITGSASEQPGVFQGFIGTFPEKFLWVRDGFLKEIERIRAEPATPTEVEDAKKYLLGSLPFRLTSNDGIASQLLAAERFGLGFDFLDKYKTAVSAVTVADVQRVAKKHLDPSKIVITAVGPIDPEGKPLGKK
ncbi:MAG: M16 family metallopeptidase [Fimbriiglobus sp.]